MRCANLSGLHISSEIGLLSFPKTSSLPSRWDSVKCGAHRSLQFALQQKLPLTCALLTRAERYDKLTAFDKQWIKCRGDHRLPRIKEFRDKFTAHLGEPKDIPEATYGDLFAFGAETAKAMELLALATGIAVKGLDTDPSLVSAPEAFWKPWEQA